MFYLAYFCSQMVIKYLPKLKTYVKYKKEYVGEPYACTIYNVCHIP